MSLRTMHTVLAGINEYRLPVSPLDGCVNDVNEWRDYLNNESSSFILNIEILLNAEVTKNAITTSLQNALTKASANDIVFFLFSGHGTREEADPVFADMEHDNALESLVCYDSVLERNGSLVYNFLSDKELHYILSQYGKMGTHIILVFDCCHSGGITRNCVPGIDDLCHERRYVPQDRVDLIAPMRAWNQFLFGENITRDDVAKIGWFNKVTQIQHITLSACQNDESAYEFSGHGIFTRNLLDVLRRTQGSITYYDLQARTRIFTQNQFRQTPEIYTIRNHEDDLLRIFLDKASPRNDMGCTVYYKKFVGWVMDLGALHGITSYSGPVIVELDGKNYTLSVLEVFSNYSRLGPTKETEGLFTRDQVYSALVKNHFSGNTSFFIAPVVDSIRSLSQIKPEARKWIIGLRAPFSISDNVENSSYVLSVSDDKLFICQNDTRLRPVTEISLDEPDLIPRSILYMRHIAQWEYVRNMCNPDFQGDEYPVDIGFYRTQSDFTKREVFPVGDVFCYDYDRSLSVTPVAKFKVVLRNRSKAKYYCSFLYLSPLFQIYGNLLDGKVIGLSPGETAWVFNGDDIELDLETFIKDFNYEFSIFYLKLFACIKPFQVETLEQSPLPSPILQKKKGADQPTTKIRVEKVEKNVNWFTRTICFKGRNPYYLPS